jgi:hypothetical protein
MPCSDERASSVCLSSRRFARCKRTAFSATRRARHSVLLPPTTCTTCSDTISRCAGQSNMPKVERPKRADGSHIIDASVPLYLARHIQKVAVLIPCSRQLGHRNTAFCLAQDRKDLVNLLSSSSKPDHIAEKILILNDYHPIAYPGACRSLQTNSFGPFIKRRLKYNCQRQRSVSSNLGITVFRLA